MRPFCLSLLVVIACTASSPSSVVGSAVQKDTGSLRHYLAMAPEGVSPAPTLRENCDVITGDTGGCLAHRQLDDMITRLRDEFPDAPEPSAP